jgi:hypothetical protein
VNNLFFLLFTIDFKLTRASFFRLPIKDSDADVQVSDSEEVQPPALPELEYVQQFHCIRAGVFMLTFSVNVITVLGIALYRPSRRRLPILLPTILLLTTIVSFPI